MREDKPDKHYINVYTTDEISNDLSMVTKVIEKGDLNSPKCSLTFKPEIVRSGQEKRCSTFFRAEIYRVSKCSTEIMIPSRSGWYKDEECGWVFLERSRYKYLDNTNLPPAMCRRFVGRTNRTVNEVFGELKPMIEQNWQSKVLFGVRLISPLLLPLEMHGIKVRTIVEALVESVSDMNVATAILKTGDFEKYDTVSLNATDADINKEIDGARDGVAAIIGPMTAAEVKQNEKKVNYIRNAAIGANGVDKNVRTIISLIARFSPENLSQNFVLTVGCSNMSDSINVKELRNLVLEFDSLYIPYIEDHFNNVKDSVEQCMAELVPDIINDKQGLYIAFHAVREVLSKYLGIELFSDEEFTYVKNLFKKNTSETVSPNYTVREQFLDVTHKLLNSGKFKIMELRDAHKDYPKKEIALILDRKNEFLSFPMAAMEIISGMIPTVKNTFELTGILKDCGTIKCTDNGARQITVSGKRSAFYSVYLSEVDYDIMNIIDFCGKEEFFFEPTDVPKNFVPLIWYNGRCAGYVLEGKGLPNPHINDSGLSGMGKNRGAYRTAEGQWRLMSKVIILDIKGGANEESLKDMKCDLCKYQIHDLKNEGFPFPIFNLSSFEGKNSKLNYILNIIGAAVKLTSLQYGDLAQYLGEMILDDTLCFSISEFLSDCHSNLNHGIKNKLQTLATLMDSYAPKDGKYKYSSCREFINDSKKITVLSLKQESLPALRSIVYTMLQSLFEHQVIDSSKRLAIYADEMQKYSADSPFQKMYAEAREFRICMTAMTQEYRTRSTDIHKILSNAAIERFYAPTSDSEKQVSNRLGKEYSANKHPEKGVGYIWARGFFWSKKANEHKFITLKGMNDDENFSDLQSCPEGYYGTGY